MVTEDELLKNARQKNVPEITPEIKQAPVAITPVPEPPKEKEYWETGFKPVEEIISRMNQKLDPNQKALPKHPLQ